jgi:hypothetical protein
VLFSMTKGSAWSWGGQKDLQDTVNETGRVLQAWEVMMRTTLNTCEFSSSRAIAPPRSAVCSTATLAVVR